MLKQLQASTGKQITIELINNRVMSGTVLAVNQDTLRLETVAGIASVPLEAVQIVWEPPKKATTAENMERVAGAMWDSVRPGMRCTAPQFYGNVEPLPSGYGQGMCCGAFKFCQSCINQHQQPCTTRFQQPQPCVWMFQQPCPEFQYQQQCCNNFQYACNYQFQPSQPSQPYPQCDSFQYRLPCGMFPHGVAPCPAFNCAAQFSGATCPAADVQQDSPNASYWQAQEDPHGDE